MWRRVLVPVLGVAVWFGYVPPAGADVCLQIQIPHLPTTTDEGDPLQPGSIASYFISTEVCTEYILTTPKSSASYPVGTGLVLPDNSTLRPDTGLQVELEATSALDRGTLLQIGNDAVVGGTSGQLVLDGNRQPKGIIRGPGMNNVLIQNVWALKTKNDWVTTDGSVVAPLINVADATNVTIRTSKLWYAGGRVDPCEPVTVQAPAIWALRTQNLLVAGNEIRYTLTGGVYFTGSTHVNIQKDGTVPNDIRYTSQNSYFSCNGTDLSESVAPSQDAITAYNGGLGTTNMEYVITNNVIKSYRQGIHLSGKGILIQGNVITDGDHSSIRLDDWRTPPDCTRDTAVKNNTVAVGSDTSSGNAQAILVNHYNKTAGEVTVSGNVNSAGNAVAATYGTDYCTAT